MLRSVFPRGPISSPTKLISGCASCGMCTLSFIRINGGLRHIEKHGSEEPSADFYWVLGFIVFFGLFYLNEQLGSLLVDLAHQLSFYLDSPVF